MGANSILCEKILHVVIQADDDKIVSLINEVEFDLESHGGDKNDLFECLVLAWNSVCSKPAGAYPVLMWFGRNFRRFESNQRSLARRMIEKSYGRVVDGQVAFEISEWFGCFMDNESLEFLAYWLSRWRDMTSEAQGGLDGFFWEAFELLETQPDILYFNRLSELEARYDALSPPAPGARPRHR